MKLSPMKRLLPRLSLSAFALLAMAPAALAGSSLAPSDGSDLPPADPDAIITFQW